MKNVYKRNLKKIIISSFILMGLYFGSFNVLGVEPKVELNPSKPARQSQITFSVEISENDAKNVNLFIQECSAKTGICYSDSRKTLLMDKVNDYKYTVTTKLIRKEATYIQYNISVETESGWTYYDELKTVNLKPTNGNSDNGGENGTPGFEIFTLIVGIMIILLIFNKKRS